MIITMHGSVAISPNPVIMENSVFRQKLGLSLTRSVLQGSSDNSNAFGVARCLFGSPDPKQSKDLVREVELKNALAFGKRFNFDIVNGEPFPSAKKMKFSHESCDDSDEENVSVSRVMGKEQENDNDGYVWTETYTQDYMAMCNKHAVNTSIIGPSRQAAASLLFAPIILSNHAFSSFTAKSSKFPQESPKTPAPATESSSDSLISVPPSTLKVESSETNNNVIGSSNNNNKSHSTSVTEKRQNRINSHNNSHHHQPSTKKSSLHALTKYTNRVVKLAVMKKQRRSIITDYLHVRRMKASNQQNGKKQ